MTPLARRALTLVVLALLNGCSSLGYYSQLASGQLHVLQAREPVAKVIADPQRPAALRQQLVKAQAARTFASTTRVSARRASGVIQQSRRRLPQA